MKVEAGRRKTISYICLFFLFVFCSFGILELSAIESSDVDTISTPENFNRRKDKYVEAMSNMRYSKEVGFGMMLLEQAERTGNYSRVAEANEQIVKSCREIDEDDWDGGPKFVFEAHAMDYVRVLLLFQNKPNLLYSATVEKLKDGKEKPGSGYPDNPNESLRFFQKQITYRKAREIGLGEFNPWSNPYDNPGTENHMLHEISVGLLLSQIYAGENYSAPDGTFPMKDNTEKIDDYWHYWKSAFYTWLSRYGPVIDNNPDSTNTKMNWGIGEKDSPNYLMIYLGDFWLLRDFVDDSTIKKYAEIYIDLLLSDWAEDELNGLYTSAQRRARSYLSEPRKYRTVIMSYLLFDNLPYDLSSALGSRLNDWGSYAFRGVSTSSYNPTNVNFPRIIIDIAKNKPVEGYFIREANGQYGSTASNPKANWVTPDYTLGFQLLHECNGDHTCGGVYISDSRGIDGGLAIVPFVADESNQADRNNPDALHKPSTSVQGVIVPGTAILKINRSNLSLSQASYPTKIWIRNGFVEKDFTSSPPWMFFRAKARSGKEVYTAVRPVWGSHSFSASFDGGEVRTFNASETILVWEVSDSTKHGSLSVFKSDVLNNSFSVNGSVVEYTSTLRDRITFNKDNTWGCKVNGVAVDWNQYKNVIKNPWVEWKFNVKEASMSRNGRTAFYDFDGNNDGVYNDPIKRVDNKLTVIPTSTLTPSLGPTTTTSFCPTCTSGLSKSLGNADCDNEINILDFYLWRDVYLKLQDGKSVTEAEKAAVDFDCQAGQTTHIIDLKDFYIWVGNYKKSF